MARGKVLTGIAAALICFAQPAVAFTAQDGDASEIRSEAEDGFTASNRIRCRRLPPPVGQRFGTGRRVCATEAQWDAYYRDIRDGMNEAFNRSKAFSN